MRTKVKTGDRVLVIAQTAKKPNDAAVAEAKRLLAQYEAEERAWDFAKQSFVPLAMLLLALVM